jgi:hypothetical protein
MSFPINSILKEEELDKNSVVRFYRTTALDGKMYNVAYYNLDMIIAKNMKNLRIVLAIILLKKK